MAHPQSQLHAIRDDDPDFPRMFLSWTLEMQREMDGLVWATRKTILSSRAAMAEVDRIIAWRL
jgi:hypothetical protein